MKDLVFKYLNTKYPYTLRVVPHRELGGMSALIFDFFVSETDDEYVGRHIYFFETNSAFVVVNASLLKELHGWFGVGPSKAEQLFKDWLLKKIPVESMIPKSELNL